MDSIAELHTFLRDFDAQHSNCPVAQRTLQLRDEKLRVRKERETERHRDEQQQRQRTAANNSITWEAIDERIYAHNREQSRSLAALFGDCMGKFRKEDRDYITDKLIDAVNKLREEFRIGQGRALIARGWNPDEICYAGDVVSYGGETFQCLQDTGKTPAVDHPHWRLLARRGRDAISPTVLGAFDAKMAYVELDIVTHDGSSFIAVRDLEPGTIPGIDAGWQLLAGRGGKGPTGATGAKGQRGARGQRGEAGPQIIDWVVDPVHYRVHMTLSNGKPGPVINLRPLFERFCAEAVEPIADAAVREAARAKLLSPLFG
jgi:hypothetical protein